MTQYYVEKLKRASERFYALLYGYSLDRLPYLDPVPFFRQAWLVTHPQRLLSSLRRF